MPRRYSATSDTSFVRLRRALRLPTYGVRPCFRSRIGSSDRVEFTSPVIVVAKIHGSGYRPNDVDRSEQGLRRARPEVVDAPAPVPGVQDAEGTSRPACRLPS